jgi:hypothetical protein
MRSSAPVPGFGALLLIFAFVVWAGPEARAQTAPLDITIGYITEAVPEADPLSLVEIVPKDKGVAGVHLGLEDNNTTGKFLKQT